MLRRGHFRRGNILAQLALAACLCCLMLSLDIGQAKAASALKIGSIGAVDTMATGQQQGGATETLVIGADVFRNQTVRTDATGLVDILFADESTITIGHHAELVLDDFAYDPDAQRGNLAVQLSDGAMRFIGGKISKKTPVQVATPLAALTIRGGIGLFSFPRGKDGLVAFIYGVEITVTGRNGTRRSIRQPGFGVSVPANGGDPSEPFRLTDEQLADLRAQLESVGTDQDKGVPTESLAPIQNFGSKDPSSPDKSMDDKNSQQPYGKESGSNGGTGGKGGSYSP
ncbi:MAG TPA: FecR domain-containing protein [Terriglobales bacterium]|nr:FecR domain-containing protein [Terriglobales bacterium]